MSLESKTIDGIDVSKWSAEHIAELRATLNDERIASQEIEQLHAEAALPENVLTDKRNEAARRKQDAADMKAFSSAKKKYGEDMIGTIETKGGLIIMRTATSGETDERDERYRDLLKSDEAAADHVWWECTKKAIVYPIDERVGDLCAKFPRLKAQIEQMYTALVNGLRTRALGK
jgi:hypothetical protein